MLAGMGLRVNEVRGRLRAPLPAAALRRRADGSRTPPGVIALTLCVVAVLERWHRGSSGSAGSDGFGATGLRPGLDRGRQSQHYFRFGERNALWGRETTAGVVSTDSPTIGESLDETPLRRRMPPEVRQSQH